MTSIIGAKPKLAASLAIASLLLLGTIVVPAHADDRHGDRGRDRGHHDDRGRDGGGYYAPPPVVYGGPGYYAPPVVYGPGVGIALPGVTIGIQ
jgi:hypothetical protein